MILPLIAIVEQPQVFLGTGEVIFDAAPRPFVVRVRGYAIAHDAGDNLKRVFKRFHRFTSCPLAVFG